MVIAIFNTISASNLNRKPGRRFTFFLIKKVTYLPAGRQKNQTDFDAEVVFS
jgi:hypothetical protein